MYVFNIIARRTLLHFCNEYPEAALPLQQWYHEMLKHNFENFHELKMIYANASIIGDDRVIFNIKGNKYRLIVRIVFDFKVVQIKWFGSHEEYNKIDVLTISYKRT